MFPDSLLNSPLFGIGLTVILYALSEILVDRLNLRILPPFVPACVGIIAILVYSPGVEYKQYAAGAEFINFLLGPATIALALPLYKNRRIIQEKALPILGGVTIATVVAIVVMYFSAKGLGASEKVLLSLIPKSVTTPYGHADGCRSAVPSGRRERPLSAQSRYTSLPPPALSRSGP